MNRLKAALTVSVASLLTACFGSNSQPAVGTGFLSDYSKLTPVEVPSGSQVWRWRSDDFDPDRYNALQIIPVVFEPIPQSTDQISREVLEKIRVRVNKTVHAQASRAGIPITDRPGPGVLVLQPAITSVNAKLQEMSITEAIPIRLVLSGAELALGLRDQDVTFLFEYKLVDTASGEAMVTGVRHANTQPLSSEREPLREEHAKAMLNTLALDLEQHFTTLHTHLKQGSAD